MLKELAKKMQSDSLLYPAAQRAMDLVFSVEVMVKKEEREEKIDQMQNMRPSRMTHYYPKIDKWNLKFMTSQSLLTYTCTSLQNNTVLHWLHWLCTGRLAWLLWLLIRVWVPCTPKTPTQIKHHFLAGTPCDLPSIWLQCCFLVVIFFKEIDCFLDDFWMISTVWQFIDYFDYRRPRQIDIFNRRLTFLNCVQFSCTLISLESMRTLTFQNVLRLFFA